MKNCGCICTFTCFTKSLKRKSTSTLHPKSLYSNPVNFVEVILIVQELLRFLLKFISYFTHTRNVWSRGIQLVLFSRECCCFPRRSRGKHQYSRKTKLTSFPRDHICFVIFRLFLKQSYSKNKQTNKQSRRAGNNCAIVSRSGYI